MLKNKGNYKLFLIIKRRNRVNPKGDQMDIEYEIDKYVRDIIKEMKDRLSTLENQDESLFWSGRMSEWIDVLSRSPIKNVSIAVLVLSQINKLYKESFLKK
jgi:hypothetical protein